MGGTTEAAFAAPTGDEGAQPALYKDPAATVEARVWDLLARMTLHEKLGQMTQIDCSVASERALSTLAVGSVLNSGDSAPKPRATPADWADMVEKFQRWALSSRLGVPMIYATDAVHGHNNVFGATVFPHNVGLGATRDRDLIRRIGEVTALEVRATGMHCAFAPCVAVCRDPRWGRCYESYSEDPDVVCAMASIVSGLQGAPPPGHPLGHPYLAGSKPLCFVHGDMDWMGFFGLRNVLACAKHFVGDGGTERGVNEGDTICSLEDLENVHMKPYVECLNQGLSLVMASYSSWNGEKLHSHRFLLTEVLKEKLGFKGFVISDMEGIDRLSQPHGSNYRHCICISINAGIDMVMVPYRYELFLEDLLSLVESGEIPMARIDDAVERILRVKFLAGLFEHPFSDRSLVDLDILGCKAHRELARETVRKSLVLLKNGKDPRRPLLPLNKNARKILVAGTHADDIGYQCGGWTDSWQGSKGRITEGTTILEAIKAAVGGNTEVIYEEFPSASTIEDQEYSLAIIVVGEVPYAETQGDRTDLPIPFDGAQTIVCVASQVPTLVIIVSGRPLLLEPEVLESIDALVAAWLPGSEGGGVADVVFGDYDFEGVLPVTWFTRMDQLPMNANHELYDPLFPLGYGLRMNAENIHGEQNLI
ncbi:hypothetical protein Taro_049453 [Colocasia esculenta]|uniref:Beta-glucosidase n=1 Tax=Colocasia esculenta TaxID=4460 RepID=A0A843XB06_COLES|nr:hypothetical protein [Colocasia esculenta]